MDRLDTQIEFVKEQITAQSAMADKYKDQPARAGRHLHTLHRLRELISFLQEVGTKLTDLEEDNQRAQNTMRRMSLTLEDIEDLPADVIAELNISETDRQELVIEDIIKRAGGVLSLDKVIVELYRRTSEIVKRNTLTSRLYRMVQKRMIFNVPGRKGLYSTSEMSEQEARRLFGTLDAEAEGT